jgi:hypothetical protein
MKTITLFLISIFSIITFQMTAQDLIGSNVRLTKEIETGGSFTASEIGLIRLNDQTNEFSFEISLFPILTSPKGNDSITNINRKVFLRFRADFPISNIDFFVNDGTEHDITLPGELTINNRTFPVNMQMGIHGALEQKNQARGIESYPVLISFMVEVNPAEYGLDFETINFVRSISIDVRKGIINKSTATPITR